MVKAKNTRQAIKIKEAIFGSKGKPFWNARVVTATPSRPTFQEPVITMHRPVMVQITIVSIKVPVIDTRPWRTGSLVFAAAAAIGAEPKPASLEKIPLAIPICMAMAMLPTIPPVTA